VPIALNCGVHFRDNLGVGRPLLAAGLVFFFVGMGTAMNPQAPDPAPSRTTEHISNTEQGYYAKASHYIDEPLKQLAKRIPQLKDLQPAQSQQQLAEILRRAGGQVDDFFRHITDMTAREEIFLTRLRQEKPYTKPELSGEHVRDSYLILRHADRIPAEVIEYRTDAKGENFDQVVVQNGFLVTSGFALSCNYFSTGFQSESAFRYLGDQKIGQQDLYVVAFAQQPDKATLAVRMRGRGGTPAHILVQGIAWIDKSNFQIVRMRTDLLAPRKDVGLNQQTTEVTFNKVQIADYGVPLWLPGSVKVYVEFTTHNGDVDEFLALSYRNEHRYTGYQRYRVSAKVVP
jgi:hypothetical protein